VSFGSMCELEFDSGFGRMTLTHYVGMRALVKPTIGKQISHALALSTGLPLSPL
jgi:hypothetical protein